MPAGLLLLLLALVSGCRSAPGASFVYPDLSQPRPASTPCVIPAVVPAASESDAAGARAFTFGVDMKSQYPPFAIKSPSAALGVFVVSLYANPASAQVPQRLGPIEIDARRLDTARNLLSPDTGSSVYSFDAAHDLLVLRVPEP